MDDKLKHIDTFFKDALEDYAPVETKSKGWRLVWFKLILMSIGIKTVAAAIIILTGMGTLLYVQFEGKSSQISLLSNQTEQNHIKNFQKQDHLQATQLKPNQQFDLLDFKDDHSDLLVNSRDESANEDYSLFPVSEGPKTKGKTPSTIKAMELPGVQKRKEFPNIFLGISSLPGKKTGYFNASTQPDPIKFNRDSLDSKGFSVVTASLLFSTQPGLVFNNIRSLETEGNPQNLDFDAEKYIATVGFGADIKVQLKRWYLRTGINYSSYGENLQFKETRYIPDYENTVVQYDTNWLWVIDPPNIGYYWLHSIDTNYAPTYIEQVNSYSANNRYHYIEVPVSFGYQRYIGQFSIAMNAGISVGFIVNQKGYWPGNNENEPSNNMQYSMRQPQLNYMMQLNFGIPLSENMQFFLEPTFKTSLNSIFDDPRYPLQQTYLSVGLNLGILIDL